MSNGCEFFADAVVARAAGRPDPAGDARLDAHLAGCAGCRAALDVVSAVRAAPAAAPAGLEARIRDAARAELRPAARETVRHGRPHRRGDWRPWMLPLAAAAAVAAVWIGVGPGSRDTPADDAEPAGSAAAYEPYGALPAAEGQVAGELVLSELSVEELERLLEDLES